VRRSRVIRSVALPSIPLRGHLEVGPRATGCSVDERERPSVACQGRVCGRACVLHVFCPPINNPVDYTRLLVPQLPCFVPEPQRGADTDVAGPPQVAQLDGFVRVQRRGADTYFVGLVPQLDGIVPEDGRGADVDADQHRAEQHQDGRHRGGHGVGLHRRARARSVVCRYTSCSQRRMEACRSVV